MDCLHVIGGRKLHGTVTVSGSKNAALPILAASIMAEAPVQIAGVPQLVDVATLLCVLKELGVAAEWLPNDELRLETIEPDRVRADYRHVSRMRASFCVLGPLLARWGRAVVSLPGGCNIGTRPVDLHLRGLEALGAEIRIAHGYVIATASRLRGACVNMAGPLGSSVTGTANVMCAATRAEGLTVIRGAAQEPEIVDLGRFLITLGATIDGLGSETILVQGQAGLGGGLHRVIPDRIEAGTLLLAVAIAGGTARVEQMMPEHLSSVLGALETAGATLEVSATAVTLVAPNRPQPTDITALPYPGIPTDLQAQWMALAATADGTSTVRDQVFPQRFMHVAELRRLGAKISHAGSSATIQGVPQLAGAEVWATDLRASAALVLAGLAARGVTTVHGLGHLDRGYVRLEDKLRQFGAQITRNTTDRETLSGTAHSFATSPAPR
jgi:UDP-N-acetylglucosamine 1-carboxyvinyltransferase